MKKTPLVLCVAAFLAVAAGAPGPALGAGTGKDMIDGLNAIDVQLDAIEKERPGAHTNSLEMALSDIVEKKRSLAKTLLDGQTVYGVPLSDIFLQFDCADVELKQAGLFEEHNVKKEAVVNHLREARDCLKAIDKKLSATGEMPRDMRKELDNLIDKIDSAGDDAEAGKLKGKELEHHVKKLGGKKQVFVLDWFRHGNTFAASAPMIFGVFFQDIYSHLNRMDLKLLDAGAGDTLKEVLHAVRQAKKIKEDLLNALKAANPDAGIFVTRAKGAEFTRICVYVKGPANQKGRVKLTGASISPSSANPANFVLGDTGNDMVSFIVMGTGTYSVSAERQQPDGSFQAAETGSTSVPGGGPSAATAPPAGGYGSQPCPAP